MAGKRSLLVIFFQSLCIYVLARKLDTWNENKIKRKVGMWIGIVLDFGILIYFKFFTNTYEALKMLFATYKISLPDLVVPIGISYYSLALAGYLIDVYHYKIKAERSYVNFLSFTIYFPAIIQGPISLYKNLSEQLKKEHFFDWNNIVYGFQRILWGYFKKVVIADRIGIIVMGILQDKNSVGLLVLYSFVLYSFQIYADFSGGIDVIMGISEMLDINLRENFRAPLISKSVTEYWQRWHCSLGDWMERYIYYPIVLNRKIMVLSKKIPIKYLRRVFSATIASFFVFVIVGIWHGTGWNYVVYGVYQAIFVSSAVLLGPIYKKIKKILHINENCISWNIFQISRTWLILLFGRYLIKASNLQQAMELLKKTFASFNLSVLFDGTLYNYGLDYKNVYLMYTCILLIVIVDILHEKGVHFRELIMKQDIVFRYTIYMICIFAIIIFGIYGPEFSKASFIYQGF